MTIMNMQNNKERAAFTLSPLIKAALEEAVPKSKRSQFVEKAIADALLRQAREAAIAAVKGMTLHAAAGEDSIDVLERARAARTRQLTGGSKSDQ